MRTYVENQKYFRVKLQDNVTIFRKPIDNEWRTGIRWVPEMNDAIGRTGKVVKIYESGISVLVPGIPKGPSWQEFGWVFPYTCLEIIR